MEPEEVIADESTQEFTSDTGEKLTIKKYVYKYPDTKHILYDVHLRTPTGRHHIWRAAETAID